jgi:squalene-hopene/tetraprenyl-beta-curcumene cyclase
MRFLPALTLLALTAPGLIRTSSAQGTHAAPEWKPEAAAEYLDRRMDEWFLKAEKLRTGDGRTTCVSCHTVVPYALVRPALRGALGANAPTPQELRLADETSRRVSADDSKQLLYDFDENKKSESQGTEAILYALILAALDRDVPARERSDATRRAMERLWATQRDDGAWDWLDVGLEPFESIGSEYQGASFAAVAAGMTPDLAGTTGGRRGIDKLRGYLREHYAAQNLHNRVWGLLASTFVEGVLTPADRDALVAALQKVQNDDGGWSLDRLGLWRWNRREPPFASPGPRDAGIAAASDGYATGIIVFALTEAGLPADHPAIAQGLQWLKANQRPVRVGDRELPAWRAHSLNFDREHGGTRGEPWRRLFMSDAATAFAALALITSE